MFFEVILRYLLISLLSLRFSRDFKYITFYKENHLIIY